MNPFQILLHSNAFWSAIISAIGLVGLNYLGIPEDIWNAVLAILVVVVAVFTADDAAQKFSLGMRDMLIEIKQAEKEVAKKK